MISSALFIIVAESTEIFGGRHVREPCERSGAERSSRPGQDDLAHAAALDTSPGTLGKALKDRVVLAVDRQQRCAGGADRGHEDRPGHHQRLLVRKQQLFPGARRGERGRKPGGAHDRRHHAGHFRVLDSRNQALGSGEHFGGQSGRRHAAPEDPRLSLVGEHRERRTVDNAELEELVAPAVGGEREGTEPVGMPGDDVEGAAAD
jgi:hypothetical protein